MALKHEELKEMGIASVGHRLTLLKSVYDIKIKQDIPVDPEHYVPLCTSLTRFSILERWLTVSLLQPLMQACTMPLRPKRILRASFSLSRFETSV